MAPKTIPQVKEALENAEKELLEHINSICPLTKSSQQQRTTTANLCEAYLDEWYTLGILEKGGTTG